MTETAFSSTSARTSATSATGSTASPRRRAPAAAEWDEREETPWPIIGEAQKIGLYGFEALAQFWATRAA